MVLEQGLQPLLVIHCDERLANDCADQPPELILRMCIVLALAKRSGTGKAAEQQDLDIGINNGGKSPVSHLHRPSMILNWLNNITFRYELLACSRVLDW